MGLLLRWCLGKWTPAGWGAGESFRQGHSRREDTSVFTELQWWVKQVSGEGQWWEMRWGKRVGKSPGPRPLAFTLSKTSYGRV